MKAYQVVLIYNLLASVVICNKLISHIDKIHMLWQVGKINDIELHNKFLTNLLVIP